MEVPLHILKPPLALVLCIALSGAQTPVPPAPPPATVTPTNQNVLPEGTPVRMRINRTVSSADAHVGDNVDFEILDDVKAGDTVVIPKGSVGMATVTIAQSKRRMARGGKLAMNIDYARLPSGDKLPLRGIQDVKGGGHTGAMTAGMVATAIVFFPAAPFFLFIKGKDIEIPKGHEVTVYTNADYDLSKIKAPIPPAVVATAPKPVSGATLTNADILRLKDAGLSDQLIIAKIKSAAVDFRLDTNDLIELKHAGLSDDVIAAMMEAPQQPGSAATPPPAPAPPAAAIPQDQI